MSGASDSTEKPASMRDSDSSTNPTPAVSVTSVSMRAVLPTSVQIGLAKNAATNRSSAKRDLKLRAR
jgi:hypothetical protein